MRARNLIVAALVAALALTVPAAAQNLAVGTTDPIKPFIPLVEKVLKEAGFTVTATVLPQARLFSELSGNNLGGGFFISDVVFQSNQALVKVPVPLFKNELVAVSVKPGVTVKTAADLKNYKVGIVRGNATHEAITKGLSPAVTDSDDQQFKMLAAGRFDVAVTSRTLAPTLAKTAGIGSYTIQEPAVLTTLLYFGLSPANAGLADKLTAAFKKWVDSGAWDKEINAVIAKQYAK